MRVSVARGRILTLSDWANIATIVTAVAILFAILSLIGDRRQRHREFENLYVQRYWAILDRQSADFRLGVKDKIRKSDRALALDYLRLCEDELELRKLGLVTNRTWESWAEGIKTGINTPLCKELIDERPLELTFVRRFAGDHHDPYKGWAPWAAWNGL